MDPSAIRRFHKLCLSTLIAVYFLILVGGIVRATGSGMGCPDWPRCFGSWVPPTSADQLPADYKEKYSAFRDKKNQKFARYLASLGFKETADKIRDNKDLLAEADFNPAKTWVEYANRLVGVTIGFFIIALAWRSRLFRKTRPVIFWLSVSCLIAVIFQGWFGSIVVSTNLTTWTITVHMFLALVIVALLAYLFHVSSEARPVPKADAGIHILLAACMLVLLIQIFLGTNVREAIDVAVSFPRESWIKRAGADFFLHRSFSWTVLILNVILIVKLNKTIGRNPLSLLLIVLILGALLSGAGMAYLSMPAFLQPLHLLITTLTFGIQFLLFLKLTVKREAVLV